MVHALEEAHRVLRPEGVLGDLRPITAEWPIEVVSVRQTSKVGNVTALPEDLEDDAASDRSFQRAADRALFTRESQETFDYRYYWDSPAEMQEYVESEWEGWVTVPGDLWERIRSRWALADGDARLRVGVTMQVARWKKLP